MNPLSLFTFFGATPLSKRTLARRRSGPLATAFAFTASLAIALFSGPAAFAVIYYWDTNDTTSGFGSAAGTWGTSPDVSTISTGTGATANTATTTSDTLYFGDDATSYGYANGSTATVTVSGTQNVGNLYFGSQSGGITLSGGTSINLGGTTPTITVNNTADTISTVLAGTTGLVKAGNGTLIISGANSYTGGTTITGGTLQVGDGSTGSINSANTVTFSSSGTLNINEAAGSSQSLGTLTFSAGMGTVQSTYGGSGNTSLTFSNVAARTAGAAGMFYASGGTNGTTNKIVLTQFGGGTTTTNAVLNRGIFFYDGTNYGYAVYDSSGYLRAMKSGDTGYTNTIGTSSSDQVVLTGAVTGLAGTTLAASVINMGANNITFSNAANVLATTGILAWGGSNIQINNGGATASSIKFDSAGGELVVNVAGSTDKLTISPNIVDNTSASSFTKTGAGNLTLSPSVIAQWSGTTYVNAGTLTLGNPGGDNYKSTNWQIAPGATLKYVTDNVIINSAVLTVNGTLDLNSRLDTIGTLAGSGTFTSASGGSATLSTGANTFSGVISGGLSITVAGATQTLAGANTYTGTTTVTSGTLTLTGSNGALTSNVTAGGNTTTFGTFIVDNTGAGNNRNNRLSSTTPVVGGGTFTYKGSDRASTNSSESVSALNLQIGTLTMTYGGTNVATLTAGSVTHTANSSMYGTVLVNGTNLGKNSTDTASVARIIITTAPTLVGTTAATTTGINGSAKNTQIVPYLVGEATAATGGLGTQTGTANTFVTYNSGTGLRPLNPTDEFTNNAITAATNTYITSATTASSTVAINSLVIKGADLTITDGQTLTNTSGAILFASSNTIKPSSTTGALTFASNTEAYIAVNSGLTGTISSVISPTSSNPVTKSGAGKLVLSGNNTFTGNVNINQGNLTVQNSGALGTGTKTIYLSNGSAGNVGLTIDGTSGPVSLPSTFTYNTSGGQNTITNLAGSNTLAGTINMTSGGGGTSITSTAGLLTISAGISANTTGRGLTLQGAGNGLISGNLSLNASNTYTVAKSGTGTWTLSGTNANGTGTFTVNGGILQFAKEVSLYNTTTGSWTAANLIVNSGGTLAFNVGGANEFTAGDVTTLLTNLGGLGGAVNNNGLRTGSRIGFDTTNASGGTFTVVNNIANSTGTGGGAIGLTKLGTGTLVLSGSNSYTGATNINAGTLQVKNVALQSTASATTNTYTIALGATMELTATSVNPFVTNAPVTINGTVTLKLAGGGSSVITLGGGGTNQNDTVALSAGGLIWVTGSSTVGGSGSNKGFWNTNQGSLTIDAGSKLAMAASSGNSLAPQFDTLNGGGTLAIGYQSNQHTLTLGVANGSGDFSGSITDNGATKGLNVVKSGTGTQTFSGLSATPASNYTGTTTIDNGTLAITTTNPSLTGDLTFGATAGNTNVGKLDLSSGSATFAGAFLVQGNNASSANTITIGNGQTLQTNGSVTIGYNSAADSTTKLTVSGSAGTWSIGTSGAATNTSVQIGAGNTTAVANAATVDLSGLATFYANLGTGSFGIGDINNAGGTPTTGGSTLILAGTSTIKATSITVDSQILATQRLKLGSGTNVLNANTITIGGGSASGSQRSTGILDFNSGSGGLTVRALNGTGRAAMTIGYGSTTTGYAISGTVDLSGHSADLLLGTLKIAGRTTASGGDATGTFTFDTDTLDVTGVTLAERNGGANTSTGTLTIGGGTATIGSIAMAKSTTSGGIATAILNLNGGTTTLGGDITKTGGAGTASATLTLNGGTLDMANNNIGGATAIDTLNFQSGTLKNVKEINAGAGLTKSTAGTLTLSGNNTFTGGVFINAGALQLNTNSAAGTGTIYVASLSSVTGGLVLANGITISNNITLEQIGSAGGSSIMVASGAGNSATLDGGTVTLSTAGTASSWRLDPNASTTLTINDKITGGDATIGIVLFRSNGGTLVLNGANDFLTQTTSGANPTGIQLDGRNAGSTLKLGNATALGNAANQVVMGSFGPSATLDLNGQTITNTNPLLVYRGGTLANSSNTAASYAGTVAINWNNFTINTTGDIALSGVVSGGNALTKAGAGTLTLSNTANTNSGKTTVQDGTLSFSAGNVSATAAQQLGTNLALDLGLANASSGTLLYTGGTGTLAKNINALGNGNNTIQNNGAGTLILAGTLTKSGTVLMLKGGAFNVTGQLTGLAANSDLVIDNATVTLTNASNNYTGPTIMQNGGKVVVAADYLGAVPGTATAGNLVLDSGTLNAADSFTLASNRGIAVGPLSGSGSGTIEVDSGKTLDYGGIIANHGSGTGSLLKTGSGTLNLAGSNSYSGNTTINAGTLNLVSGAAIASGTTTVASGAVFVANGSVAGQTNVAGVLSGTGSLANLTINSGGNFSPGSVGTAGNLITTGTMSWKGGGFYTWDVTTVADGAANDWLTVGSLNLSALASTDSTTRFNIIINSLSLVGWDGTTTHTWTLATGSSPISMPASYTTVRSLFTVVDPSGLGGSLWKPFYITAIGNSLVLNYIPEPGTLGLLAFGALALFGRRKRR